MNYYYLDENNCPSGPLSLDDLRAKAASGDIPPDPMVALEGAAQWQRLGSVGAPAGFRLERFLPEAVASALRSAARVLDVRFLNGSIDVARDVGHYGVVAAVVLAVLCGFVAAIKNTSGYPLGTGLVLVFVLIGAQYVASRFFAVNETLLARSNVRVSSLALLDCAGLLALLGALWIAVGAIIGCIRYVTWVPLLPAVLNAGFWTYFATVALHPESVNVDQGPAAGGEDAIGLAAFFMRALLKLLPLYFFAMTAVGVLVAALSLFELEGALLPLTRISFVPVPFHHYYVGGFAGIGMAVTACLVPLIGYAVFIIFSLPLDIWRVLLGLPGKLDALKR